LEHDAHLKQTSRCCTTRVMSGNCAIATMNTVDFRDPQRGTNSAVRSDLVSSILGRMAARASGQHRHSRSCRKQPLRARTLSPERHGPDGAHPSDKTAGVCKTAPGKLLALDSGNRKQRRQSNSRCLLWPMHLPDIRGISLGERLQAVCARCGERHATAAGSVGVLPQANCVVPVTTMTVGASRLCIQEAALTGLLEQHSDATRAD